MSGHSLQTFAPTPQCPPNPLTAPYLPAHHVPPLVGRASMRATIEAHNHCSRASPRCSLRPRLLGLRRVSPAGLETCLQGGVPSRRTSKLLSLQGAGAALVSEPHCRQAWSVLSNDTPDLLDARPNIPHLALRPFAVCTCCLAVLASRANAASQQPPCDPACGVTPSPGSGGVVSGPSYSFTIACTLSPAGTGLSSGRTGTGLEPRTIWGAAKPSLRGGPVHRIPWRCSSLGRSRGQPQV